MKYIFRIF